MASAPPTCRSPAARAGRTAWAPNPAPPSGVLRAGELLASRRYDGAEQLFSPCVDFGYAKRAEDAFAHWPARTRGGQHRAGPSAHMQPDLVISIWTGTPIDGHGHHRACGAATREAFDLAGDAAAFPGQLQAGLSPWQPKRLLVRVRDAAHQVADDLHINVGRFDPLLGAFVLRGSPCRAAGLHRSQNMGALQSKGGQNVVYRVGAGAPAAGGPDADPLDGLPVRLEAVGAEVSRRLSGRRCGHLPLPCGTWTRAWEQFHPQRPEGTAPALVAGLGTLMNAHSHTRRPARGPAPPFAGVPTTRRNSLAASPRLGP